MCKCEELDHSGDLVTEEPHVTVVKIACLLHSNFFSNYIFLVSTPLCFAFSLKAMKIIPAIFKLIDKMCFNFVFKVGSWLFRSLVKKKKVLFLASNNHGFSTQKQRVWKGWCSCSKFMLQGFLYTKK